MRSPHDLDPDAVGFDPSVFCASCDSANLTHPVSVLDTRCDTNPHVCVQCCDNTNCDTCGETVDTYWRTYPSLRDRLTA